MKVKEALLKGCLLLLLVGGSCIAISGSASDSDDDLFGTRILYGEHMGAIGSIERNGIIGINNIIKAIKAGPGDNKSSALAEDHGLVHWYLQGLKNEKSMTRAQIAIYPVVSFVEWFTMPANLAIWKEGTVEERYRFLSDAIKHPGFKAINENFKSSFSALMEAAKSTFNKRVDTTLSDFDGFKASLKAQKEAAQLELVKSTLTERLNALSTIESQASLETALLDFLPTDEELALLDALPESEQKQLLAQLKNIYQAASDINFNKPQTGDALQTSLANKDKILTAIQAINTTLAIEVSTTAILPDTLFTDNEEDIATEGARLNFNKLLEIHRRNNFNKLLEIHRRNNESAEAATETDLEAIITELKQARANKVKLKQQQLERAAEAARLAREQQEREERLARERQEREERLAREQREREEQQQQALEQMRKKKRATADRKATEIQTERERIAAEKRAQIESERIAEQERIRAYQADSEATAPGWVNKEVIKDRQLVGENGQPTKDVATVKQKAREKLEQQREIYLNRKSTEKQKITAKARANAIIAAMAANGVEMNIFRDRDDFPVLVHPVEPPIGYDRKDSRTYLINWRREDINRFLGEKIHFSDMATLGYTAKKRAKKKLNKTHGPIIIQQQRAKATALKKRIEGLDLKPGDKARMIEDVNRVLNRLYWAEKDKRAKSTDFLHVGAGEHNTRSADAYRRNAEVLINLDFASMAVAELQKSTAISQNTDVDRYEHEKRRRFYGEMLKNIPWGRSGWAREGYIELTVDEDGVPMTLNPPASGSYSELYQRVYASGYDNVDERIAKAQKVRQQQPTGINNNGWGTSYFRRNNPFSTRAAEPTQRSAPPVVNTDPHRAIWTFASGETVEVELNANDMAASYANAIAQLQKKLGSGDRLIGSPTAEQLAGITPSEHMSNPRGADDAANGTNTVGTNTSYFSAVNAFTIPVISGGCLEY